MSTRLRDGDHVQTGLAGCYSLDEYDSGAIKKHERTRPDKEDDRTRHMVAIEAQTGVVFLTYRQTPVIEAATEGVCATEPLFDFEASDGVHHTVWRVTREQTAGLVAGFADVLTLYIADGHHPRGERRPRAPDTRYAVDCRWARRAGFLFGGCVSGHSDADSSLQPRRVEPGGRHAGSVSGGGLWPASSRANVPDHTRQRGSLDVC